MPLVTSPDHEHDDDSKSLLVLLQCLRNYSVTDAFWIQRMDGYSSMCSVSSQMARLRAVLFSESAV